jgi:hypothetical protein
MNAARLWSHAGYKPEWQEQETQFMKVKTATARHAGLPTPVRNNTVTVGDLTVTVEAWGGIPDVLDPAVQEVLRHPKVRPWLNGNRYRVLDVRAPGFKRQRLPNKKSAASRTSGLVLSVYDYTNERALLIETGKASGAKDVHVRETAQQPIPTHEEFEEAVKRLRATEHIRALERTHVPRYYKPMPPLTEELRDDGQRLRIVNVGVEAVPRGVSLRTGPPKFNDASASGNRIVGVRMSGAKKASLTGSANAAAAPAREPVETPVEMCGFQDAKQCTTRRGTPGHARITIRKAGRVMWRFFATRPSASSGTMGSGVELHFVNFKGKRVLYRAHVPILNVQYENGACGPFRDWQYEEGAFSADGVDVAPGFRLCTQPAQTALDSGNDTGNFCGVAVYVENDEVVLVSEMEAGWYRYISMWRFASDGTIRPRFGFTGVRDECICNVHHHHCYWRLDFDVRKNTKNCVYEFNDPPLPENGAEKWHKLRFETRRNRDTASKRRWCIRSTISDDGYELIPGGQDGTADAFGVGDFWALRENRTQLDDGVSGVNGTDADVMIQIDKFNNHQSLHDTDVVVWYAAHFIHDTHEDDTDPEQHPHGHLMGPDLVPYRWS